MLPGMTARLVFVKFHFSKFSRDCGCQRLDVELIEFQSDTRTAADVKDAARVEAEVLIVDATRETPGVPRNTIDLNSATAELNGHVSQRHIKIASQELNPIFVDPRCQIIPVRYRDCGPSKLRSLVMKVRCSNDDLQANMADVLFEMGLAHKSPRSCNLFFSFFPVPMIIIQIKLKEFEARGNISTCGDQEAAGFVSSNAKMLELRAGVQPRCFSISWSLVVRQDLFNFSARFRQANDLRRAFFDLAIMY
jgi:hypothetical protein